MNCPQCQTPNGPDAGFCGNCGARLAPAAAPAAPGGYSASGAGTPLGYSAPGASPDYGAPTSYGAPTNYGAPNNHGAPNSYGAPTGAPSGYGAPTAYGAPNSYDTPTASGYGPPAGQAPAVPPVGQPPAGYPQGQYQPGTSGRYTQRSSGVPAINFNLARLTNVDKIVAIASLITLISIWLPWYTLSYFGTYNLSGTGGHGWLWIEFIVALALIVYLAARAAWDQLPFNLPVAHAPLLIVGTGIQLLLILIAFIDIPYGGSGVGWGWAAFIGLIAALAAAGPVIYPAVRSYLDSRNGRTGGTHQY
jgi:hypothetical protein